MKLGLSVAGADGVGGALAQAAKSTVGANMNRRRESLLIVRELECLKVSTGL
jgi:hypothetical protein